MSDIEFELNNILSSIEKTIMGETTWFKGTLVINMAIPKTKEAQFNSLVKDQTLSQKKFLKNIPNDYVEVGIIKNCKTEDETDIKTALENQMKTIKTQFETEDKKIKIQIGTFVYPGAFKKYYSYCFEMTKAKTWDPIWKVSTEWFDKKIALFQYTNLATYINFVENIRKYAKYFFCITGYFQQVIINREENKKKNWIPITDYVVNQLASHFRQQLQGIVFKQLVDLVIADQKNRQIERLLISKLLTIFQAYKNEDFKDIYIAGCSWYDEWVQAHDNLSISELLVKTLELVNGIEEAADSTNCYKDDTDILIVTKIVKPVFQKMLLSFDSMLTNDKVSDIDNCVTLFKRIDFENKELGGRVVVHIVNAASGIKEIPSLIALNNKYLKCTKSFQPTFCIRGFAQVIETIDRFIETFAIYIDGLFRKKQSEEEFEKEMIDAISFAVYIQDKDIFQRYYTNHFTKRMLSTTFIELERTALAILKSKFGMPFVHNMECMFKDIEAAREINTDFESVRTIKTPNLIVTALESRFFSKSQPIEIPVQLQDIIKEFTTFYKKRFSNRNLKFLSLGTAEVSFLSKFVLQVSTIQMCILLLFKDTDSLDLMTVVDKSGFFQKECERQLNSLSHAKHPILVKKDGVYKVNFGFKSKTRNVKVGTLAAQKETAEEKKETDEKVERERQFQVDAAIVRIMKTRRTLDYNNIVIEVVKSLANYFKPTIPFIKSRIESLIERDYMARSETNNNIFNYVA